MYFEDFMDGLRVNTPAREITAAGLDAFLDLSRLHLPMFMTDDAARALGHPGRLVPGPMTLSILMGLVVETGWFDHVVAVLAFEDVRFLKAVHVGHRVAAEIAVRHTRPTRSLGRGVVRLSYIGNNQDGQRILTAEGTYLMAVRRNFVPPGI